MQLPSETYVHGFALLASVTILALAVIAKYLVERSRGQLEVIGPGSYAYQARRNYGWKQTSAYRVVGLTFHLRPVFAVLLLFRPEIAGIILAVSYIAEMFLLFRYHLVLFVALNLVFVATAFSSALRWSEIFILGVSASEEYFAPAVAYVQALVIAMYSLSAIRKLRNGFLSGKVLEYGVQTSLSKRKYADHLFESDRLLRGFTKRAHYKVLASAVIVVEIAVGVLLALPYRTATLAGVCLAAVSQLSFTALFPRTLLPFTLAVFAALVLWL